MPGKSKFQGACLHNEAYKDWIALDTTSEHRARCRPCGKTFDITNMGESALKSHMKSAKHAGVMEIAANSSVRRYLVPSTGKQSAVPPPSQSGNLDDACKAHELVTNAEILWTLKVVTSHFSYRSSSETGQLFQRMFPDSGVAKAFSCGEKKCAYVTCHGLRPFFLSALQRDIKDCDYYVVLFDESTNDYLQRKQLDVHIRFWNSSHKVATRYYTSVFMGHSTSEDIQGTLLTALEPFPLEKILQISMDGPNVNLKLLNNFQEHLHQAYQVQCLDIGTCGLHTMHNAYRAGVTASKWGLDCLLSSLSALFHGSPARREDFSAVTGQETFPLNFVAHRWLENVPVIERALLLWCDIKKFIAAARKKEVSPPKCGSFHNLCEFASDDLLLAKLQFALGVAMTLKPFLTEYQTDQPMVFFLARDLETVVRKLLTKFLKCSVLSSAKGATGLLMVDIESTENHTPLEKVDVGHAAEQTVRKTKASQKDVFQFRMECKRFLVSVTKKVLERSPLRFPIVRSLSSLDPRQMCTKPDECLASFRRVLDALITAGRMSEHQRGTVLGEYTEFLQEEMHNLRMFEKNVNRLDEFLTELMQFNSSCGELWKVVKLLLVLSHGQATVERGFSVNRQVAVENLKDLSYISQRIVCDAVDKAGGVLNVPITKELRTAVSAARQQYATYLEAEKKKQCDDVRESKRRCIDKEIDAMKKRKKKLEATIADLHASADTYAEKAEAANDLKYVVRSNSLRKAARSKTEELCSLNQKIQEKRQELP
ncbi:uncharacterized protein [Dermacentor albipictus]|uniref:uncharacterized protein n=1 Tax=Dermacentor albipictus TaxID=60249 RepID=UPI0038FD0D76